MRRILILIFCFYGTAWAQGEWSMQIIDQDTREPIPFATVMIKSTTQGALADELGWIQWPGPFSGEDTLLVSALGYERSLWPLSGDSMPSLLFLQRARAQLGEVLIQRPEPPGLQLMRKVWANRRYYDPKRWDNHRYQAYSKIQLDMMNLSRKQFESLPVPFLGSLGFIYERQKEDSLGNRMLPFFLTEAISMNFVRQKPFRQKEIMVASQMKGIDNASIRAFLGSHYLTIDPYETYINVINKRFLSPMSPLAEHFYDFWIRDTLWDQPYQPILIEFFAKNPEQKLFKGKMQIIDSLFSMVRFQVEVPASADLNWVGNGHWDVAYDWVEDSLWMPTGETMEADLQVSSRLRLPAIHLTKTHIYEHYRVQDPAIDDTLNQAEPGGELVLAEGNAERGQTYWETHRPEPLSMEEASIFQMYDTLETLKPYQRLKNLAKILATGVWKTGPLEWGPYWNLYSRNPIEGHRFRGTVGTTPAFSKTWFLQAYLAYGTLDRSFKYQGSALFIIEKNPRISVFASHTDDLNTTVNYYGQPGFDNLLNLAIRRPHVPWKLTRVRETQIEYLHSYTRGFSHRLQLASRRIHPFDPLPSHTLLVDEKGNPSSELSVWELGLQFRYAFEERFLEGHYYRYSLGSKYPIIELDMGLGYREGFQGDPYQKIRFSASDQIPIPPLGKLSVHLFAGKYFGQIPYLLLENHPGNESYFYKRNSMNLFPHYSFLSDQYLGVYLEHNLEWSLFQYIPLLKKAKIRQFWNIKPMIGSLSPENQRINLNKGYAFETLNSGPYIEVGTGIENILRILRLDFVWQWTDYSTFAGDEALRFAVLGSLRLDF